jgi:hypothetical protein
MNRRYPEDPILGRTALTQIKMSRMDQGQYQYAFGWQVIRRILATQ